MKFKRWFKDIVVLINELYIKLQKDNKDVEVLHQYRINLRKLYAYIEVYTKNINEKKSKKLSKLIKSIMKPTAFCRDLDLFLIEIDKMNLDILIKEKLHTIFDSQKEKNNKKFLHLLKSSKYKKKLNTLSLIAKNNKSFIYDMQNINQYKIIKKKKNDLFKKINKINLNSLPKDFHNTRKEFKKFRYALNIYDEFFKKNKKEFCEKSNLKEILEALGNIQDNYIRLNFIKSAKQEFTKIQERDLETHFKIKILKAKLRLLKAKRIL